MNERAQPEQTADIKREIRNIHGMLLLLRIAQIGLIAFSIYSLSNLFDQTSKAIDFALGSPPSSSDVKRNTLLEIPYALAFGDPDKEINDALDRKDYGRAKLYVDYFAEHAWSDGLRSPADAGVSQETLDRFNNEYESAEYYFQKLRHCGEGALFRESETVEGITCIVGSDFFLIGDVADLGKQAFNWAVGNEVDEVIVGLSLFGAAASLTSISPTSASAAVGSGVAKGVMKATRQSKFFGKPFRGMMKRAVDMPALKNALKQASKQTWTISGWGKTIDKIIAGKRIDDPWVEILSNPAKFLRKEPTAKVMEVLDDANSILQGTDATFTLSALKRVESAADLKHLKRTVATYGKRTKHVTTFVGKSTAKIAKLSRPYVRWSKHTYKATTFGFSIAAVVFAILSEFGFRRFASRHVKALRQKYRQQLVTTHGADEAWKPSIWYLSIVPVIAIIVSFYYANDIKKTWDKRIAIAEMRTSHKGQRTAIFASDVSRYIFELEDSEQWFLEMSRFDTTQLPPFIRSDIQTAKTVFMGSGPASTFGPPAKRFSTICVVNAFPMASSNADYQRYNEACNGVISYAQFRFGDELSH